MTTKNDFWKLTDCSEINSKKALIELLEASSSVANVSYIPKYLRNSGDISLIIKPYQFFQIEISIDCCHWFETMILR